MELGTVSLILLSLVDNQTTRAFILIAMTFYGIGFGLFSQPKDISIASA